MSEPFEEPERGFQIQGSSAVVVQKVWRQSYQTAKEVHETAPVDLKKPGPEAAEHSNMQADLQMKAEQQAFEVLAVAHTAAVPPLVCHLEMLQHLAPDYY